MRAFKKIYLRINGFRVYYNSVRLYKALQEKVPAELANILLNLWGKR